MDTKARILLVAVLTALLLNTASTQLALRVYPTNVRDEGRFQGQTYTRLCSLDGAPADQDVNYEWLREGVVVLAETLSSTGLELSIPSVDFGDEGQYTCRATIIADSTVIGPVTAGILYVLDRGMIHAPPVQYIEHGVESSQLNCSYPGAVTLWEHPNGDPVSGELISPSFNDEGLYTCNIFYNDIERGIQASLEQFIRLHIFVPVEIISQPPAHQMVEGNPQYTATVAFSGRLAQNMSINWYLDGALVPSNHISNSYSLSQLSGTTELRYNQITRSQEGVYRVVIISEVGHGVFPFEATQQEASFQVDVIVPPTAPSDVTVTDVSSISAFFSWALTNQNADEAADTLILRLTYDNGTFSKNESMHGSLSNKLVNDLLPGITYSVDVIAINEDGEAASAPASFSTLPGRPSLTHVQVTRINGTHFTARVSLAYTGGGDITRINIEVSSVETGSTGKLELEIDTFPTDDFLVWTGGFSVANRNFSPEGMLDFIISTTNAVGFESEGLPTSVDGLDMPTDALTEPPPDSMVLILIAVIIGTALITFVVVTLVFISVCYCRKKAKKYNINGIKDQEKQSELPADHEMVNRHSTMDKNLATHALTDSQKFPLSSLPSMPPSALSDDRYIDSVKKPGHRRTPSDASSGKASHVSSAPSNSPALYFAKLNNEKNARDYAESLSTYTESQLSQTESETMPMKPGHSYSQIRLPSSTGSSPHGSHQSIPSYPHHLHPHHTHRRNYSQTSSLGIGQKIPEDSSLERLEYIPTPPTKHQYQNHQLSLSISGSEMDARPPSESICTCSLPTNGHSTPEFTYPPHQTLTEQQISVV